MRLTLLHPFGRPFPLPAPVGGALKRALRTGAARSARFSALRDARVKRWGCIRLIALLIVLAGALAGCSAGRGGSTEAELSVFAAASLSEPFQEIGAAFEREHPELRVRFNFGGSNQLRSQIEQGARADLFAPASAEEMARAGQSGTVAGGAEVFARNRLAVIVPRDQPAVADLHDLARPGRKLVVAGPDVPVGGYTLRLLDQLSAGPTYGPDFKARVLANVVSQETSVKQVVAKVQLGEADAGVVYVSDVTPTVAPRVLALPVPDRENPVATYPIAPVVGGRNSPAAAAFVEFLRSAEGQRLLQRHGFLPWQG